MPESKGEMARSSKVSVRRKKGGLKGQCCSTVRAPRLADMGRSESGSQRVEESQTRAPVTGRPDEAAQRR